LGESHKKHKNKQKPLPLHRKTRQYPHIQANTAKALKQALRMIKEIENKKIRMSEAIEEIKSTLHW
jgi:hypothetical protein